MTQVIPQCLVTSSVPEASVSFKQLEAVLVSASFCRCLTCKVELASESCHQMAGSDSLADWEHSLRSQPSVSLLNRHHSCYYVMISAWPPGGEEEQGCPQHTGGMRKVRIQHRILLRPVQRQWVRSASGPGAADLTVVLTTEFWRAKPRERPSAVLLKCTLVKYFSALSKHYK